MPLPENFYKNGAKAVAIAVNKICRIVQRFKDKLTNHIDNQAAAGKITTDQATQLKNMLTVVVAACDAWNILVS